MNFKNLKLVPKEIICSSTSLKTTSKINGYLSASKMASHSSCVVNKITSQKTLDSPSACFGSYTTKIFCDLFDDTLSLQIVQHIFYGAN